MREQQADRGIDTAIDRAVREMMDADTDPAFGARVLARIDEPRTSRLWPWLSFGAVAGAAILLAVLMWPGHQRAAPSTTDSRPHVSSAPPGVSGSRTQTQARRTIPVMAPTARQRTSARPPVVPPDPTPGDESRGGLPAIAVAPLTPVEAIDVAPIVRETILSSAIPVVPLTPIAAVRIEPLSAREARD